MKFYLSIIIFLSLTFSSTLRADLLSATLEYNKGNYLSSYQEFQRLAKLGNRDAIFNIGVMYLHGQGVEKNLTSAHSWFLLAADFGVEEARSAARLIEMEVNDPTSLENHYQTLNQNFSYSIFSRDLQPVFNPEQYTHDQQPKRIYTLDAKYPQEAYEKGQEGWVWLDFDIDESGAVKDVEILDAFPDNTFNRSIYNAVRRWRYEPYVVNGKAQIYRNRSLIYHFTTFKGKRYKESFASQKREYQKKISELIESAEQGNAIVQYYIANWMVADEHNATRLLKFHWSDENAGSQLLLSSASNGYSNSQYRLGSSLLRGEYTQANREKGLNWILLAAQGGFVHAQYRLARELLDKRHVEFDVEKSQRWMIAAADSGHFRAIRDMVVQSVDNKSFTTALKYLKLGLIQDDSHPDLLLAQAKILKHQGQTSLATKNAKKALKEAKSRGWYSQEISQYLQGLK